MCLKINVRRWFWELNMLIGSLVELHVGLHSCLCFSYLERLVLKVGSTPLWYLFDTLLYVKLLQLFLIAILTASWYLVDWSSFCSWFYWVVFRHLLDTSAVDDHFLTPFLTGVSIALDTCICRDLLLALFKLPVQSKTHFIQYLSRYFFVFSPKLSHLTPIFVPKGFFKLFQEFLHLVSF